jgi:hypothetical protein
MPREIHVQQGDAISRFTFSKLSREKLYGKKVRQVVDEAGNPCSPRSLSLDGSVLVASGGYAQMYVTPEGDAVSSRDITKVDLEGMGLPSHDSTLNVPQEIREVSPNRLLDHMTTSPYALTVEEIDPVLEKSLNAGKIFETSFAYRKGSTPMPAFLLENEAGYFLLVSDPHGFEFCAPDQQMVEADSDDDPFTDDFDFGMMG